MNTLSLKIFKDIAYEKNFAKVGKLNFLTQPSVSSHIKNLEELLGCRLFDRAPRKVSLTKEGEFLLPYVEDLLTRIGNLKSHLSNKTKTLKGNVKIATVYSIGIYELAANLKKFIRAYPDIYIHLQYSRSDLIYDLILQEKIDFGIVAYPKNRPRIKITPAGKDNLILIAPPKHHLAKKRSIKLQEINNENFITFDEGIPTREAINEALNSKEVKVFIRMTNDNIDTIKKAVEVGLGISIVPRKAVEKEVAQGLITSIRISDLQLSRPIGIITLNERVPTHPAQLFINMLARD
ncbi:MAG: LysR family transcriptional regulator [Candidatus Omnitrophica bacterium]|nr:LysR family transcriptional regulator [Candidatus Omnitrophota bacterium]